MCPTLNINLDSEPVQRISFGLLQVSEVTQSGHNLFIFWLCVSKRQEFAPKHCVNLALWLGSLINGSQPFVHIALLVSRKPQNQFLAFPWERLLETHC